MERQTGNGWYVGGYMLGPPESLRYRSVTILRIGRSAGNPFAESPQRPYAARPNARRLTAAVRGRRDGPDRNAPPVRGEAGETRCGRLIPRFWVRIPGDPLAVSCSAQAPM